MVPYSVALGKSGLAIKFLVWLANRSREARELMLDWSTPGRRLIMFQLYGEEAFRVAVEAGKARLLKGPVEAPDVTLRSGSRILWDIITGRMNPDAAFSMQRYDIIGSIDDAVRFRYVGELIQRRSKFLLKTLRKLLAITTR